MTGSSRSHDIGIRLILLWLARSQRCVFRYEPTCNYIFISHRLVVFTLKLQSFSSCLMLSLAKIAFPFNSKCVLIISFFDFLSQCPSISSHIISLHNIFSAAKSPQIPVVFTHEFFCFYFFNCSILSVLRFVPHKHVLIHGEWSRLESDRRNMNVVTVRLLCGPLWSENSSRLGQPRRVFRIKQITRQGCAFHPKH